MRDSTDFSALREPKARSSRIWAAISRIAQDQCGVTSLAQLLGAGLSYAQVKALVGRGVLIPLHRGVYAVGHRPVLTKAYLIAALLAAGPGAFLSHRTAAAVHTLREVSMRLIDVTIPNGKRRSRDGLAVHTIKGEPDLKTRNGLWVSSVPQMLIELAPLETAAELDRLVTQSVRKQILDLDAVHEALLRNRRRPGVAKLRKVLKDYLPRPDRKSKLEVAFDAFLDRHPEIPEPQRNIYIDGWEIDCYWPEQRLVVELAAAHTTSPSLTWSATVTRTRSSW
jgi:hypothetical protein